MVKFAALEKGGNGSEYDRKGGLGRKMSGPKRQRVT
jgi:hypothetical protein